MAAPLLRGASSSSRMTMPAPSPMTKPSRALSNGRLARVGSLLRVESARMAANPPTLIGVIDASDPPAIITSASPRRMISVASPMAWADAVQAVHVARFGPRAPKRIETCPAARLMMDAGMKNGEIRRGPPLSSSLCSRSIVENPPIPDAMNTPTWSAIAGVMVSRASSIANWLAASAYWMKTSAFLTSFFSMNCRGSKPRTSPAMRVVNAVASKCVIGATPLRPESSASQFADVPMPTDEIRPTPVMTSRLVTSPRFPGLLLLRVDLDVLDGLLHARDLLGILVGNLDPELFFEGHHELDRIERVSAKIVNERRIRRHLFFIDAQLL